MVGSTEAVDNNLGALEVIPLEESVSTERKHVNYLLERRTSLRARYAYGFIFLLINLVAWFVRDYGHKFLYRLSYLKACGRDGKDCFYVEGVLRVSLGCFIFFLFMFFTTFRSSKLYESSNSWHSRWWASKFFILIILMVVPFFIPVDFIRLYDRQILRAHLPRSPTKTARSLICEDKKFEPQFHAIRITMMEITTVYPLLAGEVARIGAGIFLLLQLISVIHFITWWNNYWMPEAKLKKSCLLGLLMSTIFYIGSVCGIVWMYLLYAPDPSCSLNIFFITWTVILLLVMMLVSLHSKVNRGILSSGIMGSYIVFLCWSAIRRFKFLTL